MYDTAVAPIVFSYDSTIRKPAAPICREWLQWYLVSCNGSAATQHQQQYCMAQCPYQTNA
jgi:hypothetical protein